MYASLKCSVHKRRLEETEFLPVRAHGIPAVKVVVTES